MKRLSSNFKLLYSYVNRPRYSFSFFAIRLPCHEASVVARALVENIFSQFVSRASSVDNGSEFCSTLMKTFPVEFSIAQILTSPYHPNKNSVIERFDATIKNMIRSLSDEFPDAWDETLPWVVFACGEAPTAKLEFSPFDFMFAREVNGPLAFVTKS